MIKRQIINFIFIGILNTVVGYSLYALFIFLNFYYVVAAFLATVLGILFNFQTFGRFVFTASNNASLIRFFSVYGVVFIVNVLLIKISVGFGYNEYISGLFALFPCAIISFLLNKFYVFRS